MLIIKNTLGSKGHDTIIAEVPFVKAPKIKASETIEGTTYYLGENGKQYIADLYDKYFKTVKTKIKGRYHKGDLIGGAAWR